MIAGLDEYVKYIDPRHWRMVTGSSADEPE